MARSILPAGIESRLKAQAEFWRRQRTQTQTVSPESAIPFLTLSRQYGCDAYALAEALVTRLDADVPGDGWSIYDRRLLELLADSDNIRADMIDSMSAPARGQVSDWLDSLIAQRPADLTVFRRLARTMCAVAARGRAVLIGRGGVVLTRALPGGLHVRLVAPLEWRLQNLRRQPDRPATMTLEALRREDEERESFVRRYMGADADDPTLYHLTLSNELLSREAQVEAILGLVRWRLPAAAALPA